MRNLFKKAVLGASLAATALTVAAPAEAQRYRGYRGHRGGDTAAGAIIGGIVGLGVGAAIASNNRNRYYDRGYYDGGYYDRGYPARGYYNDGYYPRRGYYSAPRGYYDYQPRCWTQYRFDPYYGDRVPVRVCN